MPTLGIASRGRLSNAPMLGIRRRWCGVVGWFGDVRVGVLIEVTVEVWRPVLSQVSAFTPVGRVGARCLQRP